MSEAIPVFEAKNKLPFYIHKAEAEGPVFLSRRNKEVAVVISVDDYNKLLNQASKNRSHMSFLDRVKDFHERNKDLYSDSEVEQLFNNARCKDTNAFFEENVWDGIMESNHE